MGLTGAARAWQRKYARRLYLTDFLTIVLAVFGSQFVWQSSRAADLQIQLTQLRTFSFGYSIVSIALCLLWMLSLRLFDTRDNQVIGSGAEEYRRLVDATIRVFGFVAITMYLLKSELGRGYFLTALPVGLILLILGRWAWRQWLVRRRRQGAYLHRTLLVGQHLKSVHVAQAILRHSAAGMLPVGALTESESASGEVAPGVPVLGGFADVLDAVERVNADTVAFTGTDDINPQDLRELGWSLEQKGVSLVVAPALTDVAGPRIHARPVAGLPLIHVDYPIFEGARYSAKRIFDIATSVFGLLVLSPVLVGIAVAVRRDDSGPALFRQVRMGLNGNEFKMLKFRSMVVGAEDLLPGLLDSTDGNGVLFKIKQDPRITRVGGFLRRYSLDELPQLVNVLRGDMSLVGPRPPLVHEVEQYDEWTHRRFLVKPGITGQWQVSGRSDLSWDDSVRLDLYYVENWSLVGDLIILYRTVKTVIQARGAY